MPLARLRRGLQFPHNKVGKYAVDRNARLLGVEKELVPADAINAPSAGVMKRLLKWLSEGERRT